jgi:hypothetical protein
MNKSVLEKLAKFESNVELAEVKVDLALVDDMKKLAQDMISSIDEVGTERLKIIGAKNKMAEAISKSESIVKNAEKSLNEYLKQVSDLGIDTIPPIATNVKNAIEKAKKSNAKDLKEYIN